MFLACCFKGVLGLVSQKAFVGCTSETEEAVCDETGFCGCSGFKVINDGFVVGEWVAVEIGIVEDERSGCGWARVLWHISGV